MRPNHLLQHAIDPKTTRPDGIYTIPRSYGVYQVNSATNTGKTYRIGNHPIRMQELTNQYGSCMLYALFLQREHAKALADSLNQADQGT